MVCNPAVISDCPHHIVAFIHLETEKYCDMRSCTCLYLSFSFTLTNACNECLGGIGKGVRIVAHFVARHFIFWIFISTLLVVFIRNSQVRNFMFIYNIEISNRKIER